MRNQKNLAAWAVCWVWAISWLVNQVDAARCCELRSTEAEMVGRRARAAARSTPHHGQVTAVEGGTIEVVYLPKETRVYLYGPAGQSLSAAKVQGDLTMRVQSKWHEAYPFQYKLAPVAAPADAKDHGDYLVTTVDLNKVKDGHMEVDVHLTALPYKQPEATFTQVFALSESRMRVVSGPLEEADRAAIALQKTCPVGGGALGSMGDPIKVTVGGKAVYVCCKACLDGVEDNPDDCVRRVNYLCGLKPVSATVQAVQQTPLGRLDRVRSTLVVVVPLVVIVLLCAIWRRRLRDSKDPHDNARDAGPRAPQLGFTVVELLVVISIIGLLMGLLMPAVQACREVARRSQCANNVRQLALASHEYHSSQGSFPPALCSSSDTWGQIVRLLPFLDQNLAFKDLDFSKPVTDPVNVRVTTLPLPVLRCPSDTDRLSTSNDPLAMPGWSRNNYRGNGGNNTGELNSCGVENNNGVFVTGRRVSIDQITDGTGTTALFCESVLGDGDDNVISNPGDWFVILPPTHFRQDVYSALRTVDPSSGSISQVSLAGRGFTSGNYLDSRYNHIMPPGGPSGVVPDGADLIAAINQGVQVTTPSSRHYGGVNLALVDGSVRFVANQINLQVWWALGSINGGEEIYEKF